LKRKSEQRKVVIFSTVHRAADDRIFHKQARSLAGAGYKVVIFARASHDDFLDGVRIRAIKQPSSRVKRAMISFSLIRSILKEHGDVHHFHDPELIPVGLLLRLLGKEVIYDSHEDFPKDLLAKPYLPRLLRPVLSAIINPLEKLAARRMSAVVTATDAIGRRFPGCVVLHNYPILSYIRGCGGPARSPKPETPYVAYCGTISKILGALEMPAAVKLVSPRYKIKLRLLGPFQNEAIEREVLRQDLSSVVDYRGFIPMREVYQNYAGAIAGLALYHPYPNHVEAMPNKLFECMACGVPLIASDFPLWRRIVHDEGCGLVVDPLSATQIAEAIVYLIEHPEEAKQMGLRGQKVTEQKYTWEKEADNLLRLYRSVLNAGERKSRRRATRLSAASDEFSARAAR